jgi:vacuolar-type H+-ATPase subunit I/STV1
MDEMMLLTSVIHYIHEEGPRDLNDPNEEERRKNQWKDRANQFISLGSQADSGEVVLSREFEESLKKELENLILISTDRLKEIRNTLLNMVNVQISSIDFFDNEEIDSKIAATERLFNLFFMYKKVTEDLRDRSKNVNN